MTGLCFKRSFDRRLEAWASDNGVLSLSPDEVVVDIVIMRAAIHEAFLSETTDWWIPYKQLAARLHLLCEQLPGSDPAHSAYC